MILADLAYFTAYLLISLGLLKIIASWSATRFPTLAAGIGWFVPGLA